MFYTLVALVVRIFANPAASLFRKKLTLPVGGRPDGADIRDGNDRFPLPLVNYYVKKSPVPNDLSRERMYYIRMDTKKQTRTSRIVGKLLRNRFTAPTEEREQRWLIEEHDDDRYLPPEWHPRGGILSIRKTLRIK